MVRPPPTPRLALGDRYWQGRWRLASANEKTRSSLHLYRILGVGGLHTEGQGADARLMVVHDPAQVTADQLPDLLKRLPSSHKAFLVPTLLG